MGKVRREHSLSFEFRLANGSFHLRILPLQASSIHWSIDFETVVTQPVTIQTEHRSMDQNLKAAKNQPAASRLAIISLSRAKILKRNIYRYARQRFFHTCELVSTFF